MLQSRQERGNITYDYAQKAGETQKWRRTVR